MKRPQSHRLLLPPLLLLILSVSCSVLQDTVPREINPLQLCLEEDSEPGFWYQYGVYESRPLPPFEAGFLDRPGFILHGSGSDFGEASLLHRPIYSGLGPLDGTVSLMVPASSGNYIYLLIGREESIAHYPGGGEAELALLISMQDSSDFSLRVLADSRRIIYEGDFSRMRYSDVLVRIRPRNVAEQGKPDLYLGWPVLFSEPTFPSGSYGLSWAPGGCPSDATEAVFYE